MDEQAAKHNIEDLIALFNDLFRETDETLLVKGQDEPIYLPKSKEQPYHRIIFAHGYFASALHEVAHWTVAGRKRRQLEDFGYWYKPDGRTAAEQRAFEQVEVKPQAWEWIYATACGFRFRFSADNLNGEVGDMEPFQKAVQARVFQLLAQGLPNRRGRLLTQRLAAFYQTPPLAPEQFQLSTARPPAFA